MFARTFPIAGRHLASRSRHLYTAPVRQVEPVTHSIRTSRNMHHITSGRLQNRQLFQNHKITPVYVIQSANYASFVFAVASRLLNLRTVIVAGGVYGGATALNKFESWKNNMVDKLNSIPGFGEISRLKDALKDKARLFELPDITAIKDGFSIGMPKLSFGDSFSQMFGSNLETGIETGLVKIFNARPVDNPDNVDENVAVNAQKAAEEAAQKLLEEEKAIQELNEQLLENQAQHQARMEELQNENKELRRRALVKKQQQSGSRIKLNTTDMYSQVLDELAQYNKDNNIQDHLPRVVVVGDQSAGKTSVLEMIAQARIFPRGSGEMMTRSPVKVTMSEGLNHVAKFNDSSKEYDLKDEVELESLRKEIERRMKQSVSRGQTVSNDAISLTVKGPGLRRMVLVDLPGIISTVTSGMASDTRTKIRDICKRQMENPNSIILCVQDGSLDAERSNVTDLVSSMDPSGKRTIFVMTKVDVAENSKYKPERIQKILEGKLFPMKALGYFAVVTGRGNTDETIDDIKKYEEDFFKSSSLLKTGVLKPQQLTTDNLSLAVSKCFWSMVKETINEQTETFKYTEYALEKEWEAKFRQYRKQNREELFMRAKNDIFDEVANLSVLPDHAWESLFKKKLWEKISDDVFNIFLKANAPSKNFNYVAAVELNKMANNTLTKACMEAGETALQSELQKALNDDQKKRDPVLKDIKKVVGEEKHEWNKKAEHSLKNADSALSDKLMDANQQEKAAEFMKTVVKEKFEQAQQDLTNLLGPGTLESWTNWKSRTPEQNDRRQTVQELQRLFGGKDNISGELDREQLTALRKNLEGQSVAVDNEFIQDTWSHLHKLSVWKKTLESTANINNKSGYFWSDNTKTEKPDSLVFFSKIERLVDVSSKTLKQQLKHDELQRLQENINRSLNTIEDDESKLNSLLNDERVSIAERLDQISQIQKRLGDFMEALNKEKKV